MFTLNNLKFIAEPYKKVISNLSRTKKVFEGYKITCFWKEVMEKSFINGFIIIIRIIQVIMTKSGSQKAAYAMLKTAIIPVVKKHLCG